MKIKGVPGEYAFKALWKDKFKEWSLTGLYFFNEKEVISVMGKHEYRWPVEVLDDGTIYIPDKSEFEVEEESEKKTF